jgi:SdrD B-like domain
MFKTSASKHFALKSSRYLSILRNRFGNFFFRARDVVSGAHLSLAAPWHTKRPRICTFRPSFQLLEDRRLLAGTITGRIWLDADYDGQQDVSETQNFQNVTVKLMRSGEADRTSTTDANGRFSFTVPANGSYHMSFNFPAGYTLTREIDDTYFDAATANATSTYTNYITVIDGSTQEFDAGLVLGGTMSIYCWNDADGDGIQDSGSPEQDGLADATVTLAGTEFAHASVDSDANGLALFTNIRPSTFHINAYRSSFDRTIRDAGLDDTRDSDVEIGTGNSADFVITPAIHITDIDVGFVDPAFGKGSISGKAWLDNGDGIRQAGETGLTGTFYFDLYQTTDNTVGNGDDQFIRSDATNASFVYEFLNVPVGKYYVKAAPGVSYILAPNGQGGDTTVDSDFAPATLNSSLLTVAANVAIDNIDAGLVSGSASVGDRVWNDVNANGVQDAGEAGLAGARVRLYTSTNMSVGAEIITDGTGAYLFSNLTPGNYYVAVTPPDGYLASPKDQGANDLTDSDIDRALLRTTTFAVTTTQTIRWDAGFYLGATIGNRVWNPGCWRRQPCKCRRSTLRRGESGREMGLHRRQWPVLDQWNRYGPIFSLYIPTHGLSRWSKRCQW